MPAVAETTDAIAPRFAGNGSDAAFAMPCWIFTIDSAVAKAFDAANSTL